jgi:hypothetical protein
MHIKRKIREKFIYYIVYDLCFCEIIYVIYYKLIQTFLLFRQLFKFRNFFLQLSRPFAAACRQNSKNANCLQRKCIHFARPKKRSDWKKEQIAEMNFPFLKIANFENNV